MVKIQKISRCKSRIVAALIVLIGAAFCLLIITGVFLVNTTPSVPVGVWTLSRNIVLKHGDYVVTDITSFSGFRAYAEYPFKRTVWGRTPRFLKQIAAMSGDVIELDNETQTIKINGEPLPHSTILSRDRAGNSMVAYSGLPMTLGNADLWLTSQSERGFDSRYLGYVQKAQCRKVKKLLTY